MNGRFAIEYYDRREGRIKADNVPAPRFINWAANSRSGRWAGRLIFGNRTISRIYGRIQKSRWSRRRIGPFIKSFGLVPEDLTKPPKQFSSFHDFFVRDIDPSRRPFVSDPAVCAAPVDGRILAYAAVSPDQSFPIKRAVFNLREFLRDDRLAARFAGGTLIVSRLGMGDYHYIHFPFSGIPQPAAAIRGTYYASGPYYLNRLIPFYRDNYRMMTLVRTDAFGLTIMVEVGAFAVGSIRQLFRPDSPAAKGDKKARFELGGSTVALLFEKGMFEIDPDILEHTAEGMETYVRLGDSIGRVPDRASETGGNA